MSKTFSAAPRIEWCPPSEALPHSVQLDGGKFQKHGAVVHDYLRDVSTLGAEEAIKRVPVTHRAACDAIDLDKVPASKPEQFAVEVAFAWNPATGEGRELHRGTGSRDYSAVPPGWWCGTADLLGVTDTHVIVWDYKTGFASLGEPAEHLQLLGYAIAAAATYKRESAWVGFIFLHEDQPPRFVFEEVQLWDLDAAVERYRAMEAAIGNARDNAAYGQYELVEGDHCKYCPAFAQCPAKRALLSELVMATAAVAEADPTEQSIGLLESGLTLENFGPVLRRVELMQKVLDLTKKKLDEFAGDDKQIPVGKGEVYGRVWTPRETIDTEKATVVISKYGADILALAVETPEPKITKAALKEAMREWLKRFNEGKSKKEKKGIGETVDDVEETLRKVGAMKNGGFYVNRRHKPKVLKPDEQPEITQIAPNPPKEK